MFASEKKSAIGLDISERSIKAIAIEKNEQGLRVVASKKLLLDEGIISRGQVIDQAKLVAKLKELKAESSLSQYWENCVFGLPEDICYLRIFATKNPEYLDSQITNEAQTNIPYKLDELFISHSKLGSDSEGKESVVVVGTPQKYTIEWLTAIKKADIEVEVMTADFMGLLRSVKREGTKGNTGIIDIGQAKARIILLREDKLRYCHSLNEGGEHIENLIINALPGTDGQKISHEKAAGIKKSANLNEDTSEANIIKIALTGIVNELETASRFFSDHHGEKINDFILTGGASQINGLSNYLSKSLAARKKNKNEEAIEDWTFSIGKNTDISTGIEPEWQQPLGLALIGLQAEKDRLQLILPEIKKETPISEKKISLPGNVLPGSSLAKAKTWASAHKQEAKLIAVLLIGCLLLPAAFYYRKQHSQKLASELAALSAAPVEKTLDINIPLSVAKTEYASHKIRGRLAEQVMKQPMSYEEALTKALEETKKTLAQDEAIWEVPLTAKPEQGKLLFPLKFNFAIYRDSDLQSIAVKALKDSLGETEFTFNQAKPAELLLDEKTGAYYFKTQIIISLTSDIPDLSLANPEAGDLKPAEVQQEAIVEKIATATENIFLRSGPGRENKSIGNIKKGDKLKVLEEQTDWLKVEHQGKTGWAMATYCRIE
jgi:type IV pilus assembly protein PilM